MPDSNPQLITDAEIEQQEQVQVVLDLEQVESEAEKIEHIENFEDPVHDQQHVDAQHGEETLQHVENLDDYLVDSVLSTRDGLFTPPPTPVSPQDTQPLDENEIKMELMNRVLSDAVFEEQATETASVHDQTISTTNEPKQTIAKRDKKSKQTEFKMETKIDLSRDFENDSYDRDLRTGTVHYEQEKQRAECTRYSGVEIFASNFIDKIMDKSLNAVEASRSAYMINENIEEEELFSLCSLHTYVEIFGAFTRWPRIQEFTKELGESVLNNYMQTWEYEEEWMYCIDFLIERSDRCSDYYMYEARWSIPTKPYPIPQATASVYFTFEVSRIKPAFCPVDVTYVFEGSSTVHIPGKIDFCEYWLFNIIDSKLELFKQIKF